MDVYLSEGKTELSEYILCRCVSSQSGDGRGSAVVGKNFVEFPENCSIKVSEIIPPVEIWYKISADSLRFTGGQGHLCGDPMFQSPMLSFLTVQLQGLPFCHRWVPHP